jgi:sugar/nucleoside kinase (ribokinase family)
MSNSNKKIFVAGPAYLDRVLGIDESPLERSPGDPPVDRSVDGKLAAGGSPRRTLELVDASKSTIAIKLPESWPGPFGTIEIATDWTSDLLKRTNKQEFLQPFRRSIESSSWHDDLGGMGAGYASALAGTLFSALGAGNDPIGARVASFLSDQSIEHHPIFIPGKSSDWTLLVTSGRRGDKLAIGFRGAHDSIERLPDSWADRCDLRVVAGLPNRIVAEAFQVNDHSIRLFAPSIRNMRDLAPTVDSFAGKFDLLCCNRLEWETLGDREAIERSTPIVATTDGANGCVVRFWDRAGVRREIFEPAFPRERPPRDTNRAGEAFASTFVTTLIELNVTVDRVDPALIQAAAKRASAAAALELDLVRFGFPTRFAIDRAVQDGVIP